MSFRSARRIVFKKILEAGKGGVRLSGDAVSGGLRFVEFPNYFWYLIEPCVRDSNQTAATYVVRLICRLPLE
jgi:hypothetical protein